MRPLRCSAKLSGVNTATELMVQVLFRYSAKMQPRKQTLKKTRRRLSKRPLSLLRHSLGSQLIDAVSVALLNCTNVPINTFRKTQGAPSPRGRGLLEVKTKITTAADPSSDTESQDLADSYSSLRLFFFKTQKALKYSSESAWSKDTVVHSRWE